MRSGTGAVSARLMAMVVVVLTTATCGAPTSGPARIVEASQVPYGLLATATTSPRPDGRRSTSSGSTSAGSTVFFVGRDGLLRPVGRSASTGQTTDGIDAAIAALVAGPTPAQRVEGLSSALGSDTMLRRARLDDATAVIDIHVGARAPVPDQLPLAVAQIVLTLTSVPGVHSVQLSQDGHAVPAPLPGGQLTELPLTATDYEGLRSP